MKNSARGTLEIFCEVYGYKAIIRFQCVNMFSEVSLIFSEDTTLLEGNIKLKQPTESLKMIENFNILLVSIEKLPDLKMPTDDIANIIRNLPIASQIFLCNVIREISDKKF